MEVIKIPNEKIESARRYIENNLGPVELLALCDDMVDVECLHEDKRNGVYDKTLSLLQLQDLPEALQIEVLHAAHKTFGKVTYMLFNNDAKRYLFDGPYISDRD